MRKLIYSMLAPEGGEHVQKVIILLTKSVLHVKLHRCTVCVYVCPVHVEKKYSYCIVLVCTLQFPYRYLLGSVTIDNMCKMMSIFLCIL